MAIASHILERRVRKRLAELEATGLKRTLEEPSGIDLCSNDYLGFARHPRILRRFAIATEAMGVGSTGSRLLRGHRAAFRAVEDRFAQLKGTQGALFLGSGWAANLGVLASFLNKEDVVFSDELNHASLIDGMRLSRARKVIYRHCDSESLSQLLESVACAGQRFVVTESLFSMDGDIAPLDRYAELQERHGFALVVDEAHAVGIYGATGSGAIEEADVGKSVFLSVNSAGKALGVCGAFVCGPRWAIDYLVQAARPFVFSTAPPPAVAAAIDEALTLVEESGELRRRVRGYAKELRGALQLGPGDSPIVPIILGSNTRAMETAARLRKDGFDVRAIRPPTVPAGTARLRVSLNANLSRADFQRFADRVRTVVREAGNCLAPS